MALFFDAPTRRRVDLSRVEAEHMARRRMDDTEGYVALRDALAELLLALQALAAQTTAVITKSFGEVRIVRAATKSYLVYQEKGKWVLLVEITARHSEHHLRATEIIQKEIISGKYTKQGIMEKRQEFIEKANIEAYELTRTPPKPAKQDVKKEKLRLYPFASLVNYGCLPQTWEDPDHADESTGYLGDNDPVDVVEVGSRVAECGEVYQQVCACVRACPWHLLCAVVLAAASSVRLGSSD